MTQKLISFLNKTIFKITGTSQFSAISTKKYLLSEFLNVDPRKYQFSKNINQIFIDEIMNILNQRREGKKKAARIEIQEGLRNAFYRSTFIPDSIKALNDKLFNDKVVGSGYGVVNDDPYITIGKYKVHKQHLLGGKLQVRSPVNHNQVYGFKSQNVTNNIKDILLKLNKKEPISFKDVDKLNEEEKNQLYMIGKRLHVSELFDIPSTTKSNENNLKTNSIC